MDRHALPTELAAFDHLNFIRRRGRDEYSAECPQCGDFGHVGNDWPDRFRMFTAGNGRNARGWCRSCGFFQWADSETTGSPSPEAIAAATAERARLANEERRRVQDKVRRLQETAYWQGWHDSMTQQQRQLWRNEGIADSLQDWFRLGYAEHMQFTGDGGSFDSPAMTIPVFDVGWKAVNVQYRLVSPPPNTGKYRFSPGLPQALYLTDPDNEPAGATLLVEGSKKAIITFAHLGHKLTVVAVPSKTPPAAMIERLADCDPVYVALDPDAYMAVRGRDGRMIAPAANRLVKMLKGRGRLVKLPCKPDDLFTRFNGNAADFLGFLKVAARA